MKECLLLFFIYLIRPNHYILMYPYLKVLIFQVKKLKLESFGLVSNILFKFINIGW